LKNKQMCSTACAAAFFVAGLVPASAEPKRVGIASEPMTIADGAKTMVCEKIGFLAIVRDMDGTLVSPQFPHLDIQHSGQVFALTDTDAEVDGMRVNYTSFLRFEQPDRWVFTGFDGTLPFTDNCRDITSDLAFSFPKIAVGASWGLPHIRKRVELFEAFKDDMQTRLELSEVERQGLQEKNGILETQVTSLLAELDDLRRNACEDSLRSGHLVFAVEAETNEGIGHAAPDEPLSFTNSIWDCLEDTVLVNFATAD